MMDSTAGSNPPSSHVKSLIVRISSSDEIWRRPPSRHVEDDFVWPHEWIEHRPSPSPLNHQNEVREFYPPSLSGTNRKSKVFHTIEEVKTYLQQQEAQQKRDARFTKEANSQCLPRRSNSRRRTKEQKFVCTQSAEGTIESLNKVMKLDNELSQKMRKSILIASVLCRKRNNAYSQFVGADGITYPDVRLAFGKHISMKQCELCKQRVQGPFYCRIAHEHLDVPDYDGGNSYECLRELFKCSVDNLAERQRDLVYGSEGDRKRKATESTPMLEVLEDDRCSMDLMSEEVLVQIALFIPNIHRLVSFCQTSKRMQKLLYTSVYSEKLFRGLFLQTFGKSGIFGNFELNLRWRERWGMIYGLRRGFIHQLRHETLPLNNARGNLFRTRQTLGVLSNYEETSALFYDNPVFNTSEDLSNGYFGLKILHLLPPPNVAVDWKPPVVCYGDFNGIKIFYSVNAMFENQNGQSRFESLGDEEGGGQVLTLVQCEASPSIYEQTKRVQPSFFIGYASGRVAAVTATIADCGQKHKFCISGFNDAHENEVTSLVFVDCNKHGKVCKLLYSACGGGQVHCYPNALCPENNFSMEESVVAFSSNCPIFSMASTTIHTEENFVPIICTGDGEGKLRLWMRPYEGLNSTPPEENIHFHPHQMKFVPMQVKQAGIRTGLVTRIKFVSNDLLVTGTNNGDLRIWKIYCCNKPHRRSSDERGRKPQLELKYDKMGLHNGSIEVVINCGDILLTSGGNDGKVQGVDLNTGLILGNINCHTGEYHHRELGTMQLLKSCVVDLILIGKEGSMISLCRDGTLQRWAFTRPFP
jgi:WD40 repeat protein